jgi:hypothetical protein
MLRFTRIAKIHGALRAIEIFTASHDDLLTEESAVSGLNATMLACHGLNLIPERRLCTALSSLFDAPFSFSTQCIQCRRLEGAVAMLSTSCILDPHADVKCIPEESEDDEDAEECFHGFDLISDTF